MPWLSPRRAKPRKRPRLLIHNQVLNRSGELRYNATGHADTAGAAVATAIAKDARRRRVRHDGKKVSAAAVAARMPRPIAPLLMNATPVPIPSAIPLAIGRRSLIARPNRPIDTPD